MFNQHEAQQDNYYLGIAVCCLVLIVGLYLTSTHSSTGAKYFYLSNFGTTATGQTIDVAAKKEPLPKRLSGGDPNIMLQFQEGYRLVKLQYKPADGGTQTIELVRSLNDHLFQTGSTEIVSYISSNPAIALPVSVLNELKFDQNVLLFGLALLLGSIFAVFRISRALKRSKSHAQFY
ncbi:MAG: hypothetical protein AAF468_19330 [Pseudomonadota bacterium]